MNDNSALKLVTAISLLILALAPVSAETQILKPTSHTDLEGVTSSPANAYDVPGSIDESTASASTEIRGSPSITFHTWDTTGKEQYTSLSLDVTVSSSGYTDDTWAIYYDATADTACDSTDSVLKASGSENLAVTNYTVTLPVSQDLGDIQVCLSGAKNQGPDNGRTVNVYDIRTEGVYDGTPPQYRNQSQNDSLLGIGDSVELSTEVRDSINLSSVILATDETGSWQNKTVYGSPQRFYNTQWNWANFTWNNASVTSGTVSWKLWMNDTSSNYNVTPAMSFDVDRIRPGITVYSPSGLYGTSTVPLEASADETVNAWKYSLDGAANNSFTPNTTLSVSDGGHTIRVWARDSAGNWNYSENTFTVDTNPPAFSGLTVRPESPVVYQKGQGYQFNATVSDPHLDAVRLQFAGANYTTQVAGSEFYTTLTGLSAGTYSYRWFANDTLGNANMTDTQSFQIDKAPVNTILWLNGTNGDREYRYKSAANLSARLNVSKQVSIWDDLSGNLQQRASGNGSVQKILSLEFPLGQYTVKGVFFGNENYTARNESHRLTIVDNTTPRYLSVFDDNAGRVYQGEKVVLKTRWDDNYALDSSLLAVNSSGQFSNVSVKRLSSDGWSNFSYTLPVTSFPGLLGWRQWANDTSSNYNLTPIQTQEVWGYSWSNVTLSSQSVGVGETVDVNCMVTDTNSSAAVGSYPVEVYNGTVKIGQGVTGSSGWYNTTFTPQNAQDNVPVRCAVYEDSGLQYTPVLNGSRELTVNVGEPPKLYNGIYGLNDTTLVVGEKLRIYARWNESLDMAYVEYDNATKNSFNKDYSTGPFPDNYTNFTLATNVDWFKGEHSAKIYANDSQGNLNNTLARLNFDLKGYADVKYLGPNGEVVRGDVLLKAEVTDSNTSEPVSGYNVTYWHGDTRIGYNTTNSSGIAVYHWDATGLSVGPHNGSVNISDSQYYFAADDSDAAEVNLTGLLNPVITSPSGIIHRNTTVSLTGEVYSDNGSKITAEARWLNYTDDLLATGLSTSWDVPGDRALGNVQLALNVSKTYYRTNETVENFTVYGYSQIDSAEFSDSRIQEGGQTTYRCRVGAAGNSQSIADYPVEFYNSTDYMGMNTTNSSGWASYTFTDNTAGNESIQCRIYDNASLMYNSTSPWVVSRQLETVDTTLPGLNIQEPEQTTVIKSAGQYFNTSFTDNLELETAKYSFNSSGVYQNVSSETISGTWNYSDYNFTDASFEGVLGYRVYAEDVYNNYNRTEGVLTIYGGSDLYRMALNTSTASPGSVVKATCGVRDNVTLNGLSNYAVEFYNGTNLLNTKTTAASGDVNFTYSQGYDGSTDLRCVINDAPSRYFLTDNSELTRTVNFKYGTSDEPYTGIYSTHGKLVGAEQNIETADSQWLNWTQLENTSLQQTNMVLINSSTEIPREAVQEVSFQWQLFRKVDNYPKSINDPGGNGIISFSNGQPNSTWAIDSEHLVLTEEAQGQDYELLEKGLNFYLPETEAETTVNRLKVTARVRSSSDPTEQVRLNFNDFATGGAYSCKSTGGTSWQNISCSITGASVSNVISTDQVYVFFNDTIRNNDGTQTTWWVDKIYVRAEYQNPSTGNTFEYTLGYRNRSTGVLEKIRSFDPSGTTAYYSANTTDPTAISPAGEISAYLSYFSNNTPATAAYRTQEIGIERYSTKVKYKVPQVKDYKISIKDERGNNLSGVKFTVFRDSRIDSYTSDGSMFRDKLAAGEKYNLRQSIPYNGRRFNVTYWNLSLSESVSPSSRFVPYQETNSDLVVENASSIYAIDDSNFDFDRATISIPKNGTPNVIMHCTDFDFSTNECNDWQVNRTSDYPTYETQDYIQFNVTHFDAYGVATGEPLPNITAVKIYDVTNAADREQGGTLVASGLNKTFLIEQQDHTRQYRFEFVIENEGTVDWNLSEEDELFHRGLNSSWKVEKIWYNLSGQEVGGNFTDNTVYWNTSKGGVLRNDDSNDTMWAKYIVNISEEQPRLYSQYFEVNDTSTNSGSYDYHELNVTKYGFLAVDLTEPPNDTVVQRNAMFVMNATVTCMQGLCGDVSVSARYNRSSTADTLIPTGSGTPFYINRSNTNSCGTSMNSGETCFYTWDVNATGPLDSVHLLDANASSTIAQVPDNESKDSQVTIDKIILMSIYWEKIDFGVIDPGQENVPARGNSAWKYNITIEENSLAVDRLWVRATDLTAPGWDNPATGQPYTIFAQNVSYSHQNDVSTASDLSNSYQLMASTISAGTNYSTFYWLDVPEGLKTSNYTGKIYFKANATS